MCTLHMFEKSLFDRQFPNCLLLHPQVLEVDQADIRVTFLRDRGTYYAYPAVPDESWVDAEQVTQLMDHPTITGRDQYKFC